MKEKIIKIVKETFPNGLDGEVQIIWIIYFNETSGIRVVEVDNKFSFAPYNFPGGPDKFLYHSAMQKEHDFLMEAFVWVSKLPKKKLEELLNDKNLEFIKK